MISTLRRGSSATNGVHGGRLVAALLAGAWRHQPDPLCFEPAALAEAAPLLLAAGAGGLGWRRIRESDPRQTCAVLELRQAYRAYSLQAALHERSLAHVVAQLRSAGVEPLLAKGWAAARLYPEPGLRPYGDIDLCVRPEDHAAAQAALLSASDQGTLVELHPGSSWLDDRSLDDLYAHSLVIPIGALGEVRILGPEDHLRLLCVHMLSHGVCRPIWLCDIAAALESQPTDFDWDWCLYGNRQRSDWLACAVGLAHQLLGARVDDTPVAERARRLPRWLVPTVLRQWGRGHRLRVSLTTCLRRPFAALRELPHHWANEIEATVNVGGPFNEWPRLPFQLASCAAISAQFLARIRHSGHE